MLDSMLKSMLVKEEQLRRVKTNGAKQGASRPFKGEYGRPGQCSYPGVPAARLTSGCPHLQSSLCAAKSTVFRQSEQGDAQSLYAMGRFVDEHGTDIHGQGPDW